MRLDPELLFVFGVPLLLSFIVIFTYGEWPAVLFGWGLCIVKCVWDELKYRK